MIFLVPGHLVECASPGRRGVTSSTSSPMHLSVLALSARLVSLHLATENTGGPGQLLETWTTIGITKETAQKEIQPDKES